MARLHDPDDPRGPGEVRGTTSEDDAQEILARILDDLDRGGAVDPGALRAEFPGVSEEEIARLCAAASRYEEEALLLRMDWEAAREQETPLLESDTVVGDYVVEAPIGRGGMGRVYRARQRSLGDRCVALKVLPAGDAPRGREERFSREARAASSLHHPNLAEVYGFGTEGGLHYYAMRLIEGPTLREILDELAAQPELRRKRSTRRRIVRRIAEVAGALSEVHGSGLVHRDVKPSNIMLEGPSRARIADRPAVLVDFGLVRPIDTAVDPMTRNAPATPAYAAPELLLGHEVDPRADVFSLGVTLYDLLAGRRPTERMQASAGLEPITGLAPEIDPDLAAIVAKATDPMAKWRYADAAALQRDLNAWLEGLPVAARTQGIVETAGRWLRRHPWTAVRTAAAVALLALAGVATTWSTDVLARARHAREAYRAGDVEALHARLDDLPRSAPGAWLVGADLRAARAQILEGAAGPLRPLGEAMRSDDDHADLVRASTQTLARDGLDPDSLPARALLFRLREDGVAIGALTPRLQAAIHGTMRLFGDRPDVSPEDVAASGPFRERLVELLRQSLPPQAALDVVSALGGCGTPAELPVLLDWVSFDQQRAPFAERRRLALSVLERILARSVPCALEDGLTPGLLDDLGTRLAKLAQEPPAGPEQGELDGRTWKAVLHELALAARRSGARPTAEHFASVSLEPALRLDLLCAARSDDAYPLLRDFANAPAAPDARVLRHFGWRFALYGDDDVTVAARENLRNLGRMEGVGGTHYLDPFERGLEQGAADLRGDFVLPSSVLRRIADADLRMETPAWRRGPPEVEPGLLARWDLHDGPTLEGWASGGQYEAAEPDEGVGALALSVPGVSRVRLGLDVRAEYPIAALQLVLLHCRTVRPELPYGGSAVYEVRINDRFVVRGRAEHDRIGDPTVALSIDAVEPGENVIEIVLVEATTTYNLAGVWIEAPEARQPEEQGPIAGATGPRAVDPALQTPGGPGDDEARGGQ